MELLGGLGAVHIPHSGMQAAVLPAAVANLQEPVQKTQHQQHLRKQPAERIASGFPAVGVDALRLPLRFHVSGFFGKDLVDGGEMFLIGCLAESCGECASAGGDHRQKAFVVCHLR